MTDALHPEFGVVQPIAQEVIVPEQAYTSHPGRLRQFVGRAALATACIIPTADLALSDAVFAKSYEIIDEATEMASPVAEKAVEIGGMGSIVFAESFALGIAITRRKKLQNSFDDIGSYREEKQEHKNPVRKLFSKVLNAPLVAISAAAQKVEKVGENIAKKKSRVVRTVGAMAVDAGQVNALGTSTVILQETMSGNTPDAKRIARLSGLIAGSWVGFAEAVRYSYRGLKSVEYIGQPIRSAMAGFGRLYELATTVDFRHLESTPVGVATLGFLSLALGRFGWSVAKFHEQQETKEVA